MPIDPELLPCSICGENDKNEVVFDTSLNDLFVSICRLCLNDIKIKLNMDNNGANDGQIRTINDLQ